MFLGKTLHSHSVVPLLTGVEMCAGKLNFTSGIRGGGGGGGGRGHDELESHPGRVHICPPVP